MHHRGAFDLATEMEPVLRLLHKYAHVPMSLADGGFHVYRRHSRQIVPCVLP